MTYARVVVAKGPRDRDLVDRERTKTSTGTPELVVIAGPQARGLSPAAQGASRWTRHRGFAVRLRGWRRMAIKFNKVKPGMVLLDIHRERMGNTTMRQWGKWKVEVLSVDEKNQTAVVRWNSNPSQVWVRHQIESLYTKETKAYREQRARRFRGGL